MIISPHDWGVGMFGVGKTTLVREVAKQAMEEKFFDEVAIANVTQSPNLTRIQGEVAKMIGLKFDEVIVPRRASRLQYRTTKTKDKKMILDDIWKSLNLEDMNSF